MPFKAEKMDYSYDALEPFIPSEHLKIHYEKHHIGYQNKLEDALKGTSIDKEFEDIIDLLKNYQKIEDNEIKIRIREFGGGVANHDFFWKCMKKDTELKNKDLIKEIEDEWGSIEKFKDEFFKESAMLFGSGWVYLVRRKSGGLKIIKLFNQDNPWFLGFDPLLALDLWEHSYYLEYKWDRMKYIENFWKVINWEFVEEQYKKSIEAK